MKHFILIALAVFNLTLSTQAGWFDQGEQKERERRERVEQQLYQQQQTNGGLEIVILVLAVGFVAALVVGAAVGSVARRALKHHAP